MKKIGGIKMGNNPLNMRYYNGEIDDDLPYVGVLNYDPETGLIYDEEGDVVDKETFASFCGGAGNE